MNIVSGKSPNRKPAPQPGELLNAWAVKAEKDRTESGKTRAGKRVNRKFRLTTIFFCKVIPPLESEINHIDPIC